MLEKIKTSILGKGKSNPELREKIYQKVAKIVTTNTSEVLEAKGLEVYIEKIARNAYKVMDKDDIKQTIDDFANAAIRVQQAGFDAIEIHAGHGYMLSGFLSPFANDREDEYGGSAENRARLLCEIIQALVFGEVISEGTPEQIQNDPHVIDAYLGREAVT